MLFSDIGSLAAGADGSIYVAELDEPVILHFGASGELIRRITVKLLSRRGDTLRHRSYAAGAIRVAVHARDSLANALWHRLGGDPGPVALTAVRSALPRPRYRTSVSNL